MNIERGNRALKIEVFPRAEDDIIRQFRYYFVQQESAFPHWIPD